MEEKNFTLFLFIAIEYLTEISFLFRFITFDHFEHER